jgi:hypothetical protein
MSLGACLFQESQQIEHTRGAPYCAITQGKIERCLRSMTTVPALVQGRTWCSGRRFSIRRTGAGDQPVRRLRQPPAVPRIARHVTPAYVYFARTKDVPS